MSETVRFRVEWSVEVDAGSPGEAARKALAIMRDRDAECLLGVEWTENAGGGADLPGRDATFDMTGVTL